MNLQDVIKNCDINFEVGEEIKYIDTYGVEKEGMIMQINLILDSEFDLLNGDIEYLVEYDPVCNVDRVFEENIIRK